MIGDWHHDTPVLESSRAGVSHNGYMSEAHDFKLALTRVIEPTGGPGAEFHWLDETVAASVAALGLCGGAGAYRRDTGEEADIERATAQMERALRCGNWL